MLERYVTAVKQYRLEGVTRINPTRVGSVSIPRWVSPRSPPSSSRTRAWGAGVGGGSVVPRASECVDQVVESCIESGHLGRVGTFLRAEYCCCPGESE